MVIPAPRPHWALGVAVGAFVFCVTVATSAKVLRSQDLYLHISTGRWIIANGAVPDRGIFSASMPDAPWVAHEWLAGVVWALVYDNLGWGGIAAMIGIFLAIAVGLLALDTARTLGPAAAVVAAVLGWGLSLNHAVARPHMAALPLLVLWMVAHVRARQRDGTPSLFLALAMMLWANLHGSFMLGLVFTGLFAAEALFEAETRQQAWAAARSWALFLGVAVVAAAVTPHGPRGLLFPFELISMSAATQGIYEWEASSLTNNAPLFLWCFLLGFVCLLHGVRLPLTRLAMLMLLLYMAVAHRRHSELLGLAAPILLQHAIADNIPAGSAFAARWGPLSRPAVRTTLAAASVAIAGLAAWVFCRDVVRGPDQYTPAAALAAVEARGIRGRVLNAQNFGGYMIFRGYTPFIDGRVDMYGNEFMTRYVALDQLTGLLEQYRIEWTIFEPWNPRSLLMDNLPGWSRVYADDTAIVHLRREASSR